MRRVPYIGSAVLVGAAAFYRLAVSHDIVIGADGGPCLVAIALAG